MNKVFLAAGLSLLISCGKPPCKNNIAIFNEHRPGSSVYNNELEKQLGKRKDHVEFWIVGYDSANGKEYMKIEIQDKNMCAIALMDITGNEELEQFRNVKGMSYSGAGLEGLEYETVKTDTNCSFVFKEVDAIID